MCALPSPWMEECSLARQLPACKRNPCGSRTAIGGDRRRIAALDKGNRFARADRITDPLEDPGNGARCPGSEHRFGVRRCLDCGAGEDDAGDATGCRLCKANPRGLDTVDRKSTRLKYSH